MELILSQKGQNSIILQILMLPMIFAATWKPAFLEF